MPDPIPQRDRDPGEVAIDALARFVASVNEPDAGYVSRERLLEAFEAFIDARVNAAIDAMWNKPLPPNLVVPHPWVKASPL